MSADAKISSLPIATTLSGIEEFPIVQGSTTKKAALTDVLNYITASVPLPTLQQVLSAGAVLTQNNSITGNYNLNIDLNGVIQLTTDNQNYNTPYLYLDPVNNLWEVGTLQTSIIGNATLTIYDAPTHLFTGNLINLNTTNVNLSNQTASRALALDSSKNIVSATTTLAELNFISGLSSNAQTQLNAKEPTITAGLSTDYWNGSKSFVDFGTSARGSLLTGLNITGSSILATDSILQAFGKVQNQINGVLGGAIYQGVWNATTNNPALTSSVGTKGYYYVVSVAGSTNLNGITDWKVGDWAIFNGSTWDKVDNTDAVSSVNGYIGAVNLVSSDITESGNLYYTNARVNTQVATYTGDVTLSGTAFAIGNLKVTNAMLAGSIDLTTKVTGILPSANGGTGINNGVKTITLGGSWTHIGAHTIGLTTTGNTSVTLPTSGTLIKELHVKFGMGQTNLTNGTGYVFGALGTVGQSNFNRAAVLISKAGTITEIRMAVSSISAGSAAHTITIYKNGTTTGQTITGMTLTNGVQYVTKTGMSLAVSAGDYLEFNFAAGVTCTVVIDGALIIE